MPSKLIHLWVPNQSHLGHFRLWQLGFQHADPSLFNLMVDPTTKRGVLNDWDLAYDCRSGPDTGRVVGGERTGTLPFMALDLLTEKAWKGNVQRLYRHDLEGFIWILPWVFLQFEGKELKIPALESWQTGDYTECYEAKSNLLSRLMGSQELATASWKAEWRLAESLLHWLRIMESKRALAPPSTPPLSAEEVFNSFCEVLAVSQAHYPPLEHIMHELKLTPIK